MTHQIRFDPASTRHPLRRALPTTAIRYAVMDPERWRRDLRDFWVTFAVVFTGVLTLFG